MKVQELINALSCFNPDMDLVFVSQVESGRSIDACADAHLELAVDSNYTYGAEDEDGDFDEVELGPRVVLSVYGFSTYNE